MSTQKRDLLRKGNSELAGLGIFVWSIPALVAKSDKFGRIKTCPNAGICAALCYARTGRYTFRPVVNAHTKNLEEYMSDPITSGNGASSCESTEVGANDHIETHPIRLCQHP